MPASLVMSLDNLNSSSSSFSSFSSMKFWSKVSSTVVVIKGVIGSSKVKEWNDNLLQMGNVVYKLMTGSYASLTAPLMGGKDGLQKEMHNFYRRNDTLVLVQFHRGCGVIVELQTCIMPDKGVNKQYTPRDFNNPNYVMGFVDSTKEECKALL
ncbi:hypothetical protein KI387_020826, partial [Taxus chinensis]